MADNIVVQKLKEVAKDRLISTMQSSVENVATNKCRIGLDKVSTVYDASIRLNKREKLTVFENLNKLYIIEKRR